METTVITETTETGPAEPACSVMRDIHIAPGTIREYLNLAALHYRPGLVGPFQQVWTAHHRPSAGPAEVAGVAVVGWPVLHCALRNCATGGRYLGPDQRAGARLLNAEIRTIRRVVVTPRFRGFGLAAALVRRALAEALTPRVEALSVMGRFHPFFVRAGMTAWDQPRNDCERRIAEALAAAGLTALDLCDDAACQARAAGRAAIDFARALERAVGREAPAGAPRLPALLAAARRRILGRPVYYVWGS